MCFVKIYSASIVQGDVDKCYTNEQFKQLLMNTVTSDAFMAVRHDPKRVASLMKSLSDASFAWSQQDE